MAAVFNLFDWYTAHHQRMENAKIVVNTGFSNVAVNSFIGTKWGVSPSGVIVSKLAYLAQG